VCLPLCPCLISVCPRANVSLSSPSLSSLKLHANCSAQLHGSRCIVGACVVGVVVDSCVVDVGVVLGHQLLVGALLAEALVGVVLASGLQHLNECESDAVEADEVVLRQHTHAFGHIEDDLDHLVEPIVLDRTAVHLAHPLVAGMRDLVTRVDAAGASTDVRL